MRRYTTLAGLAGALALMVSSSDAQVMSRPAGFVRSAASAKPALASPVQGGGTPRTKWTIAGGIATGDAGYDLGFALQGSYKTTPQGWPVALRIDPFLGRWTGGEEFAGFTTDFSMTMIGVQGNAAYDFPATGDMNWFVFGGLGLFYSSFSFEETFGDTDNTDSSTDVGFGIGGGLNFGTRFVLEAQFKSIGSFSTIPILFGIRL